MTGEKSVVDNPSTLVWAVRLLYLECAALAALTVWLLVLDLTSDDVNVGVAASLTVLAAIGVVFVFFVARFLGQRRRGSRGPAIVIQLFMIATGGFLIQVNPLWLGVVLMALGVLVGLLVVLPASTRALGID
ncbi:hypothetical protein Ade02nite_85810 [Paractinoplanes deccanensis]|uniref:Integral membrane protein n=1 Tax=Paractinoplanes deccanensis TaxID=113561 RepID=A0ABQ3YIV8_9ACTN|nr:hypothetical protein [Actinoplanes deccanensis]GID79940.1 hypothetical protein Ade02nite_85810 [Actinoplanes deccanensis]